MKAAGFPKKKKRVPVNLDAQVEGKHSWKYPARAKWKKVEKWETIRTLQHNMLRRINEK